MRRQEFRLKLLLDLFDRNDLTERRRYPGVSRYRTNAKNISASEAAKGNKVGFAHGSPTSNCHELRGFAILGRLVVSLATNHRSCVYLSALIQARYGACQVVPELQHFDWTRRHSNLCDTNARPYRSLPPKREIESQIRPETQCD